MTQKIVPVIMAGGKGTRLWPLSRAAAPKQFIQFIGDKTLFQETLTRVSDPALYEAPVVLTNEEFRFLVAEQARELDQELKKLAIYVGSANSNISSGMRCAESTSASRSRSRRWAVVSDLTVCFLTKFDLSKI